MTESAGQIAFLGAWQAAVEIASGRLLAADYMASSLSRLAERERVVRAWVCYDDDAAGARALAIDEAAGSAHGAAQERRGALRGLPVGVKDIIDTAAFPTEYGSPIYTGHRPDADAWCVQRVLAADGVVVGKTVTTEFAYFHPGPTTNPWNAGHTPGGSSSGSAAAVADGMVPLAFGSQTAGSIIRPASFCGIFGYKPTFGRYSLQGVKELSVSNDTLGFFARNAADVQWFDSVLVDPAAAAAERWVPRHWHQLPNVRGAAPSIALVRGSEWEKAQPDCEEAIARVAGAAAAAGATVTEHDAGKLFDAVGPAQMTVMQYETRKALHREETDPRLSDELRALMAEGRAVSDATYATALATVERCRKQQELLFGDADIILTPSSPGEAPAGIGATGDPAFNRRWTALHLPCINVPAYRSSADLPVGIQLVAREGADQVLQAAALWLEDVLGLPWSPPGARSPAD